MNYIYPECLSELNLEVVGKYINSNTHTKLKCLECGSTFRATPKSKMMNFKKYGATGCPDCTKNKRQSYINENNTDKIKSLGFTILSPYKGVHEKIKVINNNCSCGRAWWATANNILMEKSFCKPCNDDDKRNRMNYWNNFRSVKALEKLEGFDLYRKQVRLLSESNYRTYKNDLTNGGKILRGRKLNHLDHIIPISFCFKNDIPIDVCADISNLRLITEAENIKKNNYILERIPKIFSPHLPSHKLINNFIKVLSGMSANVEAWKDFDFVTAHLYFPDKFLAVMLITFDLFKEGSLKNKRILSKINKKFKDLNIRCLFVFEDEWVFKNDIVENRINYILNNGMNKRIHARKCKIELIDSRDKSNFLNRFHIQGNDKSIINIGLYHADSLVSVMTFSKPKIFMKGNLYNHKNAYELSRFCSHPDFIIPGAFSKLLTYFKRNYNFDIIFSFADERWSDGGVYEINGFELNCTIKPDYAYIVGNSLKHRWNFRKDMIKEKYPDIYDPDKTEYEMMLQVGIDRIWDCGKLKYIHEIK